MAKVSNGKHCRKFQLHEYGARTLQTDDRQTDLRRHIANSAYVSGAWTERTRCSAIAERPRCRVH